MTSPPAKLLQTAEGQRLFAINGGAPWRHWGPYLSERQWGAVREDYGPDGDACSRFPFEHALSRAYRWGKDGIYRYLAPAEGFVARRCARAAIALSAEPRGPRMRRFAKQRR